MKVSTVARLAAKYFLVLAGVVLALLAITVVLDLLKFGEQNIAGLALIWFAAPAFVFRNALGMDSYVSSIGVLDVVGLVIFYFAICSVVAWRVCRLRAR